MGYVDKYMNQLRCQHLKNMHKSFVWIHPAGHKYHAMKTYAILDEQSNRSLCETDLFERLIIKGLQCKQSG